MLEPPDDTVASVASPQWVSSTDMVLVTSVFWLFVDALF